MKGNKMLKISKILVLLTGISCGYSSCSYYYNKLQNTNNIMINDNSYTNNINYNITNNLDNNTNNNLVNNIVNNNSNIENVTYNITNNLNNNTDDVLESKKVKNNTLTKYKRKRTYNVTNNLNNNTDDVLESKKVKNNTLTKYKRKRTYNITNNLNNNTDDVLESKKKVKHNTLTKYKRKRTYNVNNKTQVNDIDTNNNQDETYESLFIKHYNDEYYYEKVSKYINNTETVASGDNKYINNIHKIFTTLVHNLKYATYNYKCDNNDVCIHLNELKRYEILCNRFKFKRRNRKWNNGLSHLNKYIRQQTKRTISVEELYNYIFNKIGILYDNTINALIKAPLDKQKDVIEDSIRILGYIIASIMNTKPYTDDLYDKKLCNNKLYNKKLYDNNLYDNKLYDSKLYDVDMFTIAINQLYTNTDNIPKSFEQNLNKNFNLYYNKLILFLDEVTKVSENQNIIINGIKNTQVKENINKLLEELNIKNDNNYKEIKEFFTKDSWNLKTQEYFELFKKHVSNLKNIICKKRREMVL